MYNRSMPVFSSAWANAFVHGLLSSLNAFSRYSFTATIRAIFVKIVRYQTVCIRTVDYRAALSSRIAVMADVRSTDRRFLFRDHDLRTRCAFEIRLIDVIIETRAARAVAISLYVVISIYTLRSRRNYEIPLDRVTM